MKTLTVLFLSLVLASCALATPTVSIYRYCGADIKTLPANARGNNASADPWVKEEQAWSQGKKIALLVHGFPMFDPGKNHNGLTTLALHLSQPRQIGDTILLPAYDVIYAVEYPQDFHILETARVLAGIVNDKLPTKQKIDIFAHSMGGLVSRTAIEYPEILLGCKNISDRVDHLVTMGTPHKGFSTQETQIIEGVFGQLPVEITDMDPMGLFINMLNFTSSKKPKVDVDYYSIVGARSYFPEEFGKNKVGKWTKVIKGIQDNNFPVHDGLINSESAGYDLKEVCRTFKCIVLSMNHDAVCSHEQALAAIDKWMVDDKWYPVTPLQTPEIKYTGGFPVMLGKSRAEVIKAWGINATCLGVGDSGGGLWDIVKNDKNLNQTQSFGYLGCYPIERIYSDCEVAFFPFKEFDLPMGKRAVLSEVNIVSYHSIGVFKDYYLTPIGPKEVVPKEILDSEPTEICWYNDGGEKKDYGLVVIWRYAGNTFVLCVKDGRRELMDFTVSNKDSNYLPGLRVSKNKNTTDFRNAENVKYFFQIKGEVNLFAPRSNGTRVACYEDIEITFANRGFILDKLKFYRFLKP